MEPLQCWPKTMSTLRLAGRLDPTEPRWQQAAQTIILMIAKHNFGPGGQPNTLASTGREQARSLAGNYPLWALR